LDDGVTFILEQIIICCEHTLWQDRGVQASHSDAGYLRDSDKARGTFEWDILLRHDAEYTCALINSHRITGHVTFCPISLNERS
jgi:hypothetical protein